MNLDLTRAFASALLIGVVILVIEHFGLLNRGSRPVRALLVAMVVFAVLLVFNLLWPAANAVAGQAG